MSFASRSAEVPDGFTVETLATNLNAATAFAVAPDGRVFIADQTGPVRVWKDGRLLAAPALDLTGRVDDYWERGLLGLAFHPDFPHTPHLFALYVAKAPYTHHVVSRFTVLGDRIDPASELVLLEGDDQSELGGKVPHGHQGGPIRFGPDGKLHIALGEQTAGEPSQRLDSLLGKILRINPDGSIPGDNPFVAKAAGKYRAIWSLGHRNPYGLAFQPGTGRLFETEVGGSAFEEVNEIVRGANYGWPHAEGLSTNAAFRNPLHFYPPAIGRSIVGATFAPASDASLGAWAGKLFFADWAANWIRALDVDAPENVKTFAKGLNAPAAIEFDRDGSLLVLNRGTIWRDGKKWQSNSGSLLRIRTGASQATTAARPQWPRTLAAVGVFRTLRPLDAAAGFVEFQLIAPPWHPGVTARRWIQVPENTTLAITASGEFAYPNGARVIEQWFVAATGAPFETHVYDFTGPRTARAAAYRWNAAQSGAELIEDGEVIPLPGDAAHRWFSPGAEGSVNLDMAVAGFVLPLSPRQLTRATLAAWGGRGILDRSITAGRLDSLPRLAALEDASAPEELRIRSFLDANCAACHRPGGPSRGGFDARFETPLAANNLLNGELLAGDLGISGARVVVPGHPEQSVLLQRLRRADAVRMPPIAVNDSPSPVAPLLESWIRSLKPDSP